MTHSLSWIKYRLAVPGAKVGFSGQKGKIVSRSSRGENFFVVATETNLEHIHFDDLVFEVHDDRCL